MAGTEGMDPDFAAKLQGLVNASQGKVWINSGYRSVERQTQLYNDAIKKYGSPEAARKWVAPPGHSNHNKGLAADLGGDMTLAHRLASQFGLVFPMGWEPWHIEPPNARSKNPNYAMSQTTPPDGAAPAAHPYKDSQVQMWIFGELMKGRSPEEIDKELGLAQTTTAEDGTQTTTTPSTDLTAQGGDLIGKFLAAVRQHESGGNYHILTKGGGSASGAYQIIDSTWGGYGGYKHAMDAPPEVQDAKAREMAAAYQRQFGNDPRLWSAAWYGGSGTAQRLATGKMSWDAQPNAGLSLKEYADWVVAHMGGATPVAATTPNITPRQSTQYNLGADELNPSGSEWDVGRRVKII